MKHDCAGHPKFCQQKSHPRVAFFQPDLTTKGLPPPVIEAQVDQLLAALAAAVAASAAALAAAPTAAAAAAPAASAAEPTAAPAAEAALPAAEAAPSTAAPAAEAALPAAVAAESAALAAASAALAAESAAAAAAGASGAGAGAASSFLPQAAREAAAIRAARTSDLFMSKILYENQNSYQKKVSERRIAKCRRPDQLKSEKQALHSPSLNLKL